MFALYSLQPPPPGCHVFLPSPQAKELGHNITTHGDFMSAEERTAKSQVGDVIDVT